MNKVILMGRLARDPEVRYSQGAEPVAVARYTLAVDRKFKRQGEQEADFINCVAFGKTGEFAEKHFKKGQMVSIVGRIQVRSWEDREGKRNWTTEVIVGEHYFCGTKAENSGAAASEPAAGQAGASEGFYPVDEDIEDDDLPFWERRCTGWKKGYVMPCGKGVKRWGYLWKKFRCGWVSSKTLIKIGNPARPFRGPDSLNGSKELWESTSKNLRRQSFTWQ